MGDNATISNPGTFEDLNTDSFDSLCVPAALPLPTNAFA